MTKIDQISDERSMADVLRQPESRPFQEAAAQGRFVIPRCKTCAQVHWYPRALCPFCFSQDIEWTQASGRGTIYSYTVMRRAKPAYAIGYVTLDEGVTMMTNLVGCALDDLRIGMAVEVGFQNAGNGTGVPVFRPTP